MMTRQRVDELLTQQEYFSTQEEAARAILAGEVFINDAAHRKVLKPGEQLSDATTFDVKTIKQYVSRGGEKLKGALSAFNYDLSSKNVVDAGASTGGFTDCALQEGAAHVSAIDVGYGQLAWKLRNDQRVSVYERMNIREADAGAVGGPFDVAVADLSFIPLDRVLPALIELVNQRGDLIILVKPQFEAAQSEIGHKGVVSGQSTHSRILADVLKDFARYGLTVCDVTFSPIKGPEGNIEFWIYASRQQAETSIFPHQYEECAARVVAQAYEVLG